MPLLPYTSIEWRVQCEQWRHHGYELQQEVEMERAIHQWQFRHHPEHIRAVHGAYGETRMGSLACAQVAGSGLASMYDESNPKYSLNTRDKLILETFDWSHPQTSAFHSHSHAHSSAVHRFSAYSQPLYRRRPRYNQRTRRRPLSEPYSSDSGLSPSISSMSSLSIPSMSLSSSSQQELSM